MFLVTLEVRHAFVMYDKNLNGTIHTDKLIKVMRALFVTLEVRHAFVMYDKNLNGTIHTDKLIKVMRALGKNPTEDEIDEMKFDAYTDMDGRF